MIHLAEGNLAWSAPRVGLPLTAEYWTFPPKADSGASCAAIAAGPRMGMFITVYSSSRPRYAKRPMGPFGFRPLDHVCGQ